MLTNNWIVEFRGDSRANIYPIRETILHTSSQYQEIVIAETLGYGRALFLDGIPQSAAVDEHIYHETLIHPAMVANPHPRSVFIAGGGEGAVLREILKHNTVERIVMVDIDEVLINIVREHLVDWHQGTFNDPRVTVLCQDAKAYLEQTDERFDCIFGDLPDPLEGGPAVQLFTSEFYTLLKSRLNPGARLVCKPKIRRLAGASHTSPSSKTCKPPSTTLFPTRSLSHSMVCPGGLQWQVMHRLPSGSRRRQ